MNIKKYIGIYRTLFNLNFSATTAYQKAFYSMLAGSIMWAVFQYISILLLTSKVKSIFGWTRHELIVLTAAYSFFWGIFHFVFARNFSNISRIINYGELDLVLAKPVDAQFLLSFWRMNFAGLFRTFLGLVILVYMLYIMHISVTLVNAIAFLLLGLFGLVLIYAFWFITITLLIYNPRLSNLIDLLYNITGVTRYPPQMIYEIKNYVLFFLLPLTFAVSTPTKALLSKVLVGDIAGLLFFTVLLFLISRWFFKFSLRFYTSSGG